MENLTTIIVTIVASTGFWSLLTTLIVNRGRKKTAEQKLLIGLARAEIIRQGNEMIKQGAVSVTEYADYEDFCNAYLALGGNGGGEAKFNEVKKKVSLI